MDEVPGTPSVATQSRVPGERDRVTRDVAQGASVSQILGGSQRDAVPEIVLRRSGLHFRSIGGGESRESVQDLAFPSRWIGPASRHAASVASIALSTLKCGYRGNSAV